MLRGKKLVTHLPVPPLRAGALPPLGPGIAPGRVLDDADVRVLKNALMERDRIIHRYQSLELSPRRKHDAIHTRITALLHNLCLPLAGGLRQERDSVRGAYTGGWVSSRLEVRLRGGAPTQRLKVMGWVPPPLPEGDAHRGPDRARSGVFILELKTASPVPPPLPENDQRGLAFGLQRQRMSRA